MEGKKRDQGDHDEECVVSLSCPSSSSLSLSSPFLQGHSVLCDNEQRADGVRVVSLPYASLSLTSL